MPNPGNGHLFTLAPCAICNEWHGGMSPHAIGHDQDVREGVGFIRLIAIGKPNGAIEFCFRCGCVKSGWVNIPNEVLERCTEKECVCHIAERCR
jgi:hypothetical protein